MTTAVIGGGLTGCLIALGLADRGTPVVIFEAEAGPLRRASLANEGKIHLGYVYSADASFRTARTLIDDALLFRPLLERWMTATQFDACVTDTFHYIIPDDSRLPRDRIAQHVRHVDTYLEGAERRTGQRYLGRRDERDAIALPATARIATRERAVWPKGIADAVVACVTGHPLIEIRPLQPVKNLAPSGNNWTVTPTDPSHPPDGPFEAVVNAAWASRRAIDRASGFPSDETWFTRFKFGVLLQHASQVFVQSPPRNGTGTTGPYGDSVYYPQNDSLYCSWYPVGMCYTSRHDLTDFRLPNGPDMDRLIRQTWAGYATIDPDYRVLATHSGPLKARLIGDFIVARGASDIVDAQSGLHQRWVHGPRQLAPGYWTVDTGKYSSAPRCAAQCVDAILGGA